LNWLDYGRLIFDGARTTSAISALRSSPMICGLTLPLYASRRYVVVGAPHAEQLGFAHCSFVPALFTDKYGGLPRNSKSRKREFRGFRGFPKIGSNKCVSFFTPADTFRAYAYGKPSKPSEPSLLGRVTLIRAAYTPSPVRGDNRGTRCRLVIGRKAVRFKYMKGGLVRRQFPRWLRTSLQRLALRLCTALEKRLRSRRPRA
jgi:hypothetical protein